MKGMRTVGSPQAGLYDLINNLIQRSVSRPAFTEPEASLPLTMLPSSIYNGPVSFLFLSTKHLSVSVISLCCFAFNCVPTMAVSGKAFHLLVIVLLSAMAQSPSYATAHPPSSVVSPKLATPTPSPSVKPPASAPSPTKTPSSPSPAPTRATTSPPSPPPTSGAPANTPSAISATPAEAPAPMNSAAATITFCLAGSVAAAAIATVLFI